MPYQLYRYFDAKSRLLYVGISKNAMKRSGQHSKAPWSSFVARVEIEDHPTEAKARKAERWAIVSEAPLFNRQHATGLPSNGEVGMALKYTLAEAYKLASEGELLHTLDPIEYATMNRQQRREHRRVLNRIARKATLHRKGVKRLPVTIHNITH